MVRFILAEEGDSPVFRFAPLQGALFGERVSPEQRAQLPDSLVVVTADGRLLTRSVAVVHVLTTLGGGWRVLAAFARIVPTPIRDLVYDAVAAVRYRVFGTRDELCPVISAEQRSRFDLR